MLHTLLLVFFASHAQADLACHDGVPVLNSQRLAKTGEGCFGDPFPTSDGGYAFMSKESPFRTPAFRSESKSYEEEYAYYVSPTGQTRRTKLSSMSMNYRKIQNKTPGCPRFSATDLGDGSFAFVSGAGLHIVNPVTGSKRRIEFGKSPKWSTSREMAIGSPQKGPDGKIVVTTNRGQVVIDPKSEKVDYRGFVTEAPDADRRYVLAPDEAPVPLPDGGAVIRVSRYGINEGGKASPSRNVEKVDLPTGPDGRESGASLLFLDGQGKVRNQAPFEWAVPFSWEQPDTQLTLKDGNIMQMGRGTQSSPNGIVAIFSPKGDRLKSSPVNPSFQGQYKWGVRSGLTLLNDGRVAVLSKSYDQAVAIQLLKADGTPEKEISVMPPRDRYKPNYVDTDHAQVMPLAGGKFAYVEQRQLLTYDASGKLESKVELPEPCGSSWSNSNTLDRSGNLLMACRDFHFSGKENQSGLYRIELPPPGTLSCVGTTAAKVRVEGENKPGNAPTGD